MRDAAVGISTILAAGSPSNASRCGRSTVGAPQACGLGGLCSTAEML